MEEVHPAAGGLGVPQLAFPPMEAVAVAPPVAEISTDRHVKLPEFWADKPLLWFKQTEAAFRRSNITSSFAKYDFVFMKLPTTVLDSVADIVNSVDDTTPDAYEQLRDRLIGDLGMSQWQQFARIVDHPGLGDARPSALMAQLTALLPVGEKPGGLFQYHFLRHMPADIRSNLAGQTFPTARHMAAQADLMWDARGNNGGGSVSAVQSGAAHRRPAGKAKKPSVDNGLCFYHNRFADRATACKPPCSWQGNGPTAGDN